MHLRTLASRMEQLAERGLLRIPDDDPKKARLVERFGPTFVDLSSNDYLNGSARRGVSRETPVESADVRGRSVSRETVPRRADFRSGHGQTGEASWVALRPEQDPWGPQARGRGGDGVEVAESGTTPGTVEPGTVSRETSGAWGTGLPWGAGSSRLLHGSVRAHLGVEELVAAWLGQPAALLFASGYAANVGALSALIDPEDCVISDALNHASLIDGIRLSRAKPTILPHLDLDETERALQAAADRPARWVVTEAYFSMDGDGPDLAALRSLCDRYDAHLYVDEAHSLGVFGPEGRGRLAAAGVQADVVMGAFGKAVAAQGACVGASGLVRTWLWNRARSFVFSTAVSPVLAAGLEACIRATKAADAERERLEGVVQKVRAGLAAQGWNVAPGSFGPIVSLLVGTPQRAVELAAALEEQGVLLQAIRPPTVPEGGSRIRLTLHADLSSAQVERLLQALAPHATQVSADGGAS